ncbi:DNA damage-regulated autophagy modulator protein 1 [Fasciolopsis buskii]|uniref:DNA damage-regulated autophagy modulator protein 1 n=1 Tax=Fasciolopsis buskii TaxID=27845 RepID=A0A8E0RMH6_9TREM|nr:DNA damage-regulated autophagy modulator protein 1 [Fasciolopsis buski]
MCSPQSHHIFARITLALGLVAALGLSLVANFQETNVLVVHGIGAFMTFGCGTLYTFLHCHASRKHLNTPPKLSGFRIFLSVVSALAFFFMTVFAVLSKPSNKLPPMKWDPQEEGYVYHALSCFCEWLLAFSFLVYFSTMVFELRDYCLDPVKVSGFSDDMSHR